MTEVARARDPKPATAARRREALGLLELAVSLSNGWVRPLAVDGFVFAPGAYRGWPVVVEVRKRCS